MQPLANVEIPLKYEDFIADLPRGRTLSFTSAEENEEMMKQYGINQEVRQLGKGKFSAEIAVRGTAEVDLLSDRFNTSVSISIESPAGIVGLLFPRSASGQFVASGVNVAEDKLVVLPPGSEVDIVGPNLIGSDCLAIPEKRFIEIAQVLCPAYVRPERSTLIEGNTTQFQALRYALVALVSHPELELNPEQVSNLLESTIAWMGNASEDRVPGRCRPHGTCRQVAKHAQEFLEEHYKETIRMEGLCCLTKVGVRTLQRCFKEYFGLTITNYLKMVRLNAAYRELNSANAIESSVTQIALEHGFTHFGRFSVAIREQFGESPNETLRRRRDRKWFPALGSASR